MFDGVKSVAQAAANLTALVEQIDPAQIAALAGSLVQWAERIEAAIGRIESDQLVIRAALARIEGSLEHGRFDIAAGTGGAADAASGEPAAP